MAREKLTRGGERLYLRWLSWKNRAAFSQVQTYCMFIGYPRSGHSLAGALLNAHPDVVIAHELDALKRVERGYKCDEIFSLLLQRDQWFTRSGSRWYEFNYHVPGQWQGRYRNLKVIGDKKGGTSAAHLLANPGLLDRLREILRVPLRLIHLVRNPYDNIATLARRRKISLEEASRQYFELADSNQHVLATSPAEEILTIRHEDLVLHARENLQRLLTFIGVEGDDKYFSDCALIIFETPNKSRLKEKWDKNLVERIASAMGKYPFFEGYSFES